MTFIPDYKDAAVIPSPNHDERKLGVDLLLLHYTGMKTAADARARLIDPAAKVSSHYLVDEDGGIAQLVPEARRAWHAGLSSWKSVTDINSCSVGIEIVNPGHEFGYRDFPEAQIEAVIALCRDIVARHSIPARRVLAHSDVAPARKEDPGERFPCERRRPVDRAGTDP
jgi:N-acetylmuramoyl-L-alanine amidase